MKTNYKEHSNKSGIYQIVNESNNRFYIGSAKLFKTRFNQHLNSLRKGKHHNKFLQADFNKCGEDAFVFEVLEVTSGTLLERRTIEETYLKRFFDNCTNCYNSKDFTLKPRKETWSSSREEVRAKISAGLKRAWKDDKQRKQNRSELSKKMWNTEEYRVWKLQTLTGRKNSEDQKKRMSEAALARNSDSEDTKKIKSESAKKRFQDPVQRDKLAQASKNKPPMSEETRKKLSKSLKGRVVSDETRKKISESNKGKTSSDLSKRRTVECKQKTYNVFIIDPQGIEHFLGTNLANFCRERNLNIALMCQVILGRNKHHKGWHLKKNYKEFKSQQDV